MTEAKAWVLCVGAAALTVVACVAIVQILWLAEAQSAFDRGYTRVMLPGAKTAEWAAPVCR